MRLNSESREKIVIGIGYTIFVILYIPYDIFEKITIKRFPKLYRKVDDCFERNISKLGNNLVNWVNNTPEKTLELLKKPLND